MKVKPKATDPPSIEQSPSQTRKTAFTNYISKTKKFFFGDKNILKKGISAIYKFFKLKLSSKIKNSKAKTTGKDAQNIDTTKNSECIPDDNMENAADFSKYVQEKIAKDTTFQGTGTHSLASKEFNDIISYDLKLNKSMSWDVYSATIDHFLNSLPDETREQFIEEMQNHSLPERSQLMQNALERFTIMTRRNLHGGESKDNPHLTTLVSTPLHDLCKNASVDEIANKYHLLLKLSGYKDLNGKYPLDIILERFGEVPVKLIPCVEDIEEKLQTRYKAMRNNFCALAEYYGYSAEMQYTVKNRPGFCYGLVYMWGQSVLENNKTNTIPGKEFEFIIQLLSRDFSSDSIVIKNDQGEKHECTSISQLVKVIDDESRLPLRAFMDELISAQIPLDTSLPDALTNYDRNKIQDMAAVSELYGKFDNFASLPFLGSKQEYKTLLTDLFDELKKLPENSFVSFSCFGHICAVSYDAKNDQLLVCDPRLLRSTREFIMPFHDISTLADSLFMMLTQDSSQLDPDGQALALDINVFTRPTMLKDNQIVQKSVEKIFAKQLKSSIPKYFKASPYIAMMYWVHRLIQRSSGKPYMIDALKTLLNKDYEDSLNYYQENMLGAAMRFNNTEALHLLEERFNPPLR